MVNKMEKKWRIGSYLTPKTVTGLSPKRIVLESLTVSSCFLY